MLHIEIRNPRLITFEYCQSHDAQLGHGRVRYDRRKDV